MIDRVFSRKILVIIILVILIYLPVLYGLKDAFIDDNGNITFKYILDVLSKPNIRRSIIFTTTQALLSAVLSLIIGFIAAVALILTNIPGERILRTYSLLVFMSPPMIVITGFTLLYGRNGLLSSIMPWLGFLGEGFWAIIAAHVFYNIPLTMNFIYSSITSMHKQYIDAIAMYSRGRILPVIQKIIIPVSIQSIVSSFILTYIYCFTSFAIPLTLGGIEYSTLEVYIYRYYKLSFNNHLAAAIALIQFTILLILVLVLLKTYSYYMVKGIPTGRYVTKPITTRSVKILFSCILYIIFIYLILPILVIPYYSFINPYTGDFSLEGYMKILNPFYETSVGITIARVYINTFYFASMTAVLSVILSLLIVYYGSDILDTVYLALLAISPLTLSLGLIRTYGLFFPTPFIIIFAHTIASLPLTIRIIRSGFIRIQRIHMDIARVFGERGIPFILRVLLPLIRPALITAIVFSIVISFGEFSATYFLSSSETITLSLLIYVFRGLRDWQASASAATILLFLSFIILLPIIRKGEGVEIR